MRQKVGALLGAHGSQVIFGPSATALVFAFTRALARTWKGSERIICTQLDHDSNVTPWVLAAADAGARGDDAPGRSRATARSTSPISSASSPRRRRVGRAHRRVEPHRVRHPTCALRRELAHDAGARLHVDAVARAPHLPIDVNGWNIDSLVTSPYKWYGPHAGILVLQPDLLRGVEPYRVRPADYDGPERWETGTKSFEAIAGVGGAASFMAETPWDEVMAAEAALLERLESGLRAIPGVTVHASAVGRGPRPDDDLQPRRARSRLGRARAGRAQDRRLERRQLRVRAHRRARSARAGRRGARRHRPLHDERRHRRPPRRSRRPHLTPPCTVCAPARAYVRWRALGRGAWAGGPGLEPGTS